MQLPVSIQRREPVKTSAVLHDNALVNRLLQSRGVLDPAEMNFALADLPRFDTMLGIEQATERLFLARTQQERVLIVGDYDCDGATSTSLAVLGLKAMGFKHVDFLVPNRFVFGYGLSPAIVDEAAKNKPQLIVTVDNGVASVDGVERAKELGIDVVVTDHHLPPPVLPQAVAIVNPNIPGATFPSGNLAGVGVCFYVLLALRAKLVAEGVSGGEVKLAEFLDLVAIGTVADVVPLDNINRILVEQGLRRIRQGFTRPGVKAILSQAGRLAEQVSAGDIAYAIGPRLNAAGRLDDMTRGIDCLLSDDDAVALRLATELDALNKQRRSIENSMRKEAEAALQETDNNLEQHQAAFGVALFNENWHQGVIGIVAGRIKDQLYKPVIVFAAENEQTLKGSARSIPGVHIRDVLDAVATNNPDLIDKFGGHAMAAGLSLPRSRLGEFIESFNTEVKRVLEGVLPVRTLLSDGGLQDDQRTLVNAALLEGLCPWGQDFAEPVFDDSFTIESAREVGQGHLKLRLRSLTNPNGSGGGAAYEAIAFNQPNEFNPNDPVHLVYSLSVNRYRDRESLQLMVLHIQISDE